MQKKIEIKIDDQIYLRTLFASDVTQDYVGWLNDYEVTKYTEQKNFKHSHSSTLEFVEQKVLSKKDILFGIFFKSRHIGNIKLGPINWFHSSAEVSFFIGDKNFWGYGIASKCVKSLVNYAVGDLNLKKINAGYYQENLGSAKVFKKCGFSIEGIQAKNILFEGKRISLVLVGYVAPQEPHSV